MWHSPTRQNDKDTVQSSQSASSSSTSQMELTDAEIRTEEERLPPPLEEKNNDQTALKEDSVNYVLLNETQTNSSSTEFITAAITEESSEEATAWDESNTTVELMNATEEGTDEPANDAWPDAVWTPPEPAVVPSKGFGLKQEF